MTYKTMTKWSVLKRRQLEAQHTADLLAHQLEGLDNTPCGLKCSGCGTELPTEGDFARHFILQDERFLNLGECSVRLGLTDDQLAAANNNEGI